jgi:hypothetical protein
MEKQMMEFIDLLLKTLGGGALIVLALSKWLGDVWSRRIIEGIKGQHAKEISDIKHELAIKFEEAKWPIAREDALAAEFRVAIENTVLPMMSAVHSVCWLTWFASEFSDEFTKEHLEKYDKEAHELLPKVSGYMVLVAAYDKKGFEVLRGHVNSLYELDSDVGTFAHALLKARKNNDDNNTRKNFERLKKCHDKAVEMADTIPSAVADFVSHRVSHRATNALNVENG